MQALVLFGVFFIFLVLGIPLAIAIGMANLFVVSLDRLYSMMNVVQQSFVLMESIPLLAIAFFITTGFLMTYGGAMEGLVDVARVLVGHLHGGLAQVSIVASMFFAGVSGSAAADASGIGSMLIPGMKRSGYDAAYSAGINSSSATLGVIIPPSIPMVVYAITAEQRIGALFLSGAIPGIVFGLASIVLTHFVAVKRGYPRGERASFKLIVATMLKNIPVLILPAVILIPLIVGWATVTEVSAIAVFYALMLGVIQRKLGLREIVLSLGKAAVMTGAIMFIVGMSAGFAWLLTVYRVPQMIASAILAVTDSPFLILLIMTVFLWIVGLFIEFLPAILLLTPIFLRLAMVVGISPIHLGAIMIVNLSIGLSTPPVGGLLIVSAKIARAPIEDVVRSILPYIVLALVVGLLTTFVEPFAMWLPRMVYGL